MTGKKKLIEVTLPLDAINVSTAREKSIRHGPPSTLHLWWARRLLAGACRLFPRNPDSGLTTVNYDFVELLARAEVPR